MRYSPTESRALRVLWPYLLLGVLVVMFFWDSFFASQVLCMRDTFCIMPSSAQLFHHNMPTGEWIPFWNPFNGFGKPWFAEPIAGFFYPFHWVYALFQPGRAITIHLALHVWIAGTGMFALCRHWKLLVGPAMLAAVSFMFSTWLVAMMEFRELFATVVWGPLDLLMVSWLLARLESSPLKLSNVLAFVWQWLGWIALFALMVAVQLSAGYPQMLLYNLLLGFGFAVARSLWLRRPAMLGLSLFALMLAGVVAACLCLPQLLLTSELIGLSERSHGIDPGLDKASMHPRHLITLLLPFVYGRPGYPKEFWGETLYEFWLGTCYVGIVPIVVATFSVLWLKKVPLNGDSFRRFLVCFSLATAMFGLVMAAGKYTPVYMFFYRHLPGFGYFRWPSKFLLLLAYSMSFLAALGLQGILESQRSRLLALLKWGWMAVLLLFGAGYFWARVSPELFRCLTHGRFVFSPAHYQAALGDYLTGVVFLALAILSLGLLFWRPGSARWVVMVLAALAFVNLFVVSRQIHFRTNGDIFEVVPDFVARKKFKEQPYQFYSDYANQWLYGSHDRSLYLWAKNSGLNSIWEPYRIFHEFQDGLKLERWMKLHAQLALSQLALSPLAERIRLTQFMNIRYVVTGQPLKEIVANNAPKTVVLVTLTNCLPRAYLVSDWDVQRDPEQVLKTILAGSFDIRQRAVIEPLPSSPAPVPSLADTASLANREMAGVSSIQHTWNTVKLDVSASARSLLVLVETWYPGWKALVDGRVQPIFRANYNFRAVLLEPGRHQVVFIYQPWQFRFGLGVSLATASLLLCLLCLRRRYGVVGFTRTPLATSPPPGVPLLSRVLPPAGE